MNLDQLRQELPPLLLKIADNIISAGGSSYLVGGWVRDAILGMQSRDYDVEVYGLEQDALLALLRRYGHPNLVGKSYGVINLMTKSGCFDFSFPRLERKVGAGHRAFEVEARPDLDFRTAALRRDFTINAMGMELPALTLEDPFDGVGDLSKKILRHVGPAFAEDPLRVLRAVQFAARFELTVVPETVDLCRTLDLTELSKERLYEEFRKWLLKSARPSKGLEAFSALDLQRFFPWIIPSLRLGEFLDRLAQVRQGPEVDQCILMFAGLGAEIQECSDLEAFLQFLTSEVALIRQTPMVWREGPVLIGGLSNRDALQAPWLRRLALRVPMPQVFRWCKAWLEDGDPLQQELLQAEELAKALGVWARAPEPYLTGKMLMGLGMHPGKLFGVWIAESFELQLDGLLHCPEEALQWAMRKKGIS